MQWKYKILILKYKPSDLDRMILISLTLCALMGVDYTQFKSIDLASKKNNIVCQKKT
jgi:hypothetical protein